MENLKLPICPICNDTKHVEENQTVKLLVSTTQYHCDECKVEWYNSTVQEYHG